MSETTGKRDVVQRHQIADYLNIGTSESPNWVLMGVGFTSLNETFGAESESSKLELYYPIIPRDLDAAVDQIMWFYQGGKKYRQEQARRSGALDLDDTQRIYSFEHDDDYIYAAFFSQYHIDLQKVLYMHWWKFRAMFHSLRSDMKISEIMGYRSMEINGKMTPEQRDYYQKMKNLYALPVPADEVEKADAIAAALMNGGDLSGLL